MGWEDLVPGDAMTRPRTLRWHPYRQLRWHPYRPVYNPLTAVYEQRYRRRVTTILFMLGGIAVGVLLVRVLL